ncbi:MAG TPA: hypothetical protein PLZ15_07095 [Melioribacteraceae bacterium]|nr:hypothetical protein [Melioribacteraceae bacterium]
MKDLKVKIKRQTEILGLVLANHNGTVKQFLLNNIKSVEQLDKKFKPVTQKQIDQIFSTSFKYWLGDERYKVKLKFSPLARQNKTEKAYGDGESNRRT